MSAVNELEIKSKSFQQAVVPAFLTARRADNKDIRIFLFVCSIKNAKLSLIRLSLAVAAEVYAVAEAVQLFGNAEVKGIEVEAVGGYPLYFICVHITILSAQAARNSVLPVVLFAITISQLTLYTFLKYNATVF